MPVASFSIAWRVQAFCKSGCIPESLYGFEADVFLRYIRWFCLAEFAWCHAGCGMKDPDEMFRVAETAQTGYLLDLKIRLSQKQLGVANAMYGGDYDDFFPDFSASGLEQYWYDMLFLYCPNSKVFACPGINEMSAKSIKFKANDIPFARTYAANLHLHSSRSLSDANLGKPIHVKITQVKHGVRTPMIFDACRATAVSYTSFYNLSLYNIGDYSATSYYNGRDQIPVNGGHQTLFGLWHSQSGNIVFVGGNVQNIPSSLAVGKIAKESWTKFVWGLLIF